MPKEPAGERGGTATYTVLKLPLLLGSLPLTMLPLLLPLSLNLSYFVARTIWRRCGVSPRRCRAHRLQRREPRRWLLVLIHTTFDLLQPAIN